MATFEEQIKNLDALNRGDQTLVNDELIKQVKFLIRRDLSLEEAVSDLQRRVAALEGIPLDDDEDGDA
jgi:hypothetical protein